MYINYSVLFAEDYEGQYSSIADELADYNIKAINCKNTSLEIQISILNFYPSVVVLNGSKLGIKTIKEIMSQPYGSGYSPLLYSISAYEDSEGIEELSAAGVHFNIPSPYNSCAVAGHLKVLCEKTPIDEKNFKDRIHSSITDILKEFKASPSRAGWDYFIDAIMIVLFERSRKINLNRYIYPRIAEKRGVSAISVERAMRVFAAGAWKNAPLEVKKKYFPDSYLGDKKPTNLEFIMFLSDHIYISYREQFDKFYRTNGN